MTVATATETTAPMTVAETARFLGLGTTTVRRPVHLGELPAVRTAAGHRVSQEAAAAVAVLMCTRARADELRRSVG